MKFKKVTIELKIKKSCNLVINSNYCVCYHQKEFVDESGNRQLRNKKVRILKDKEGNEILMVITIYSNVELIVQLKTFIFYDSF